MTKAILVSLALAGVTAPVDVSSIRVSQPALVCELDMDVLKGDVRRLSWSADGAYIHLQTQDRETLRDYIVALPEGVLSFAFGEPEWSARYWAVKSDLAAPGAPDLKIEVFEDHQRTRPAPFTGGFAPNGGQAIDLRNPVDTFAIEVKLKLLGEEVGYFLNDVAYGGITFGWGPSGSGALVFVDVKGRVVLFDRGKHKLVVPTTRDARLPAWSPDGTHVAFIQKDGRRKYRLMLATLSPGSSD